jgi:hypothetical protein
MEKETTMKDFSYYDSVPVGVEYYGGSYLQKVRNESAEAINKQLLTAADRERLLKELIPEINKQITELNKPYYAARRKRDAEFYADARESLGYDKFLNETGVALVQGHAYQRGHAGGYSEIYYELSEITELLEKLSNCFTKVA